MPQFTQPVSMQVTQKQYDKDLKEPLEILGYNQSDIGNFSYFEYLMTNFGPLQDHVGNLTERQIQLNDRYFIDHYNPKLFLAIAAMSNEQYGIAGEHWKCTDNHFDSFTKNKLYKARHSINNTEGFINNKNETDGFNSHNLEYFVKATKEELINLFTKKEPIMTKVDRTLDIKCSNQEEFDAVVRWLKDNNEEVFYNCNYADGAYSNIYCMESNRWSSCSAVSNFKTPQELGIINNSQLNNMQKEFPEKWAIKLSQEVKDWIVSEFKSTSYTYENENIYFHFPNYGGGKPSFKTGHHTSSIVKEHYTEITLQQFKDNILNKPTMKNSLTRSNLIELHKQFNCSTFRVVIEEILNTNILASDNTTFYISDNAIERLKKDGTLAQKDAVIKLGIILEKDKSIDVTKFIENTLLKVRNGNEFKNKAFFISPDYNWEIKKDSVGELCLIPTKK